MNESKTDFPSRNLRKRWAKRLASGKTPLFTVLTSRGSVVLWTRGQMRPMQMEVPG